MKISSLEKLTTDMVGDGKKPDLFFLSTAKDGVVGITRKFHILYNEWKSLLRHHPKLETTLENRTFGVICSNGPYTLIDYADKEYECFGSVDDSCLYLEFKNKRGKK